MFKFLPKENKNFKEIKSFEDLIKYLNLKNREIKIDILTPQIANNIDCMIRFWNIEDEELKKTFAEREPIKLYINSLGGSLDAALSIVDTITLSRTPVYTFNIGTVQKESFLIYLAGHKRLTYPNSYFVYAHSMLIRPLEEKKIPESTFYNEIQTYDTLSKNMKLLFLDKVNITESLYDKNSKNDWWFSADDALKLHIANEISRRHFHTLKNHN